MTKTGNITTAVISSICLVIGIAVTVYYGTWDSRETNWDLLSWTFTHQDSSYDYQNIDFSEFCTEMRFAFWAGVALAGMELLNLTIFVFWWRGTRRSQGYRKVLEGKDINFGVALPNWSG
ncbi:Nn.00g079360.m01.CDS01 [Neocucurbitaria sp. VM-36]